MGCISPHFSAFRRAAVGMNGTGRGSDLPECVLAAPPEAHSALHTSGAEMPFSLGLAWARAGPEPLGLIQTISGHYLTFQRCS